MRFVVKVYCPAVESHKDERGAMTKLRDLRIVGDGLDEATLQDLLARGAIRAVIVDERSAARPSPPVPEAPVPEAPVPEAPVLTPRQTDVFEYLRVGQTCGQIAYALGISEETVRSHSAAILRKYGVRNKRELIGLPARRSPAIEAD
jgi:DNA-binding NarL/FixJ family response regulator